MSKNELIIIPKIEKYIEYILTMSMGTVLFDTKNIAFFIANKENDRFTLLRYAFK